jgi:hypothetical protein
MCIWSTTTGLLSTWPAAEWQPQAAIILSPHQSSELSPLQWASTFIASFKTAIRGTYHHVRFMKYRYRYLAETHYRAHRRFELLSLVGRVVHAAAYIQRCSQEWTRLTVSVV